MLRDTTQSESLRREAAKALGQRATPAADEALLAAVSDDAVRVRESVLDALGAVPPLESTRRGARAQAVRRALTDPAYTVRGAALSALTELDEAKGHAEARRWLSRGDDSPTRRLHTAAAAALSSSSEAADLALLLKHTGAQHRRWSRQAAARSAVEVAKRRGEDLAPGDHARLQRALFALATDEDQRPRRLAIGLLAEVGDEAAAQWLEQLAATALLDSVRSSARDAAARIRKRESEPSDPDRAAADLQRLSERLDALRREVETLSARP